MMSTKVPVAARMPVFTAAPLPLLYGCRMTRAPAAGARVAVSSADPSSTTRISCHGAAARRPPTSVSIVGPSLNAGMTTEVRPALALSMGDGGGGLGGRGFDEPLDDTVPRDAARAI